MIKHLPEIVIGIGLLISANRCTDVALANEQSRTLQVLNQLPDTPGDRSQIANTIDKLTDNRYERAMLIAVAWYESNLHADVESCQTKGDGGKAVGLWQSWAFKDRETCPTLEEQAAEAIRHLRLTMNACRSKRSVRATVRGAVSLYATGRTCYWSGATKRIKLWDKIMTRL